LGLLPALPALLLLLCGGCGYCRSTWKVLSWRLFLLNLQRPLSTVRSDLRRRRGGEGGS